MFLPYMFAVMSLVLMIFNPEFVHHGFPCSEWVIPIGVIMLWCTIALAALQNERSVM